MRSSHAWLVQLTHANAPTHSPARADRIDGAPADGGAKRSTAGAGRMAGYVSPISTKNVRDRYKRFDPMRRGTALYFCM